MSPFNSLLSEIKRCQVCSPFLALGAKPILQIHPKAKILLAGQAPGKQAHLSGIPFNDPSGERLRSWLGVEHKEFYDATQIAILPMGLCYPGKGRSGDLPPRPECAVTWHERILTALPKIELILVIGKYAQSYYLNKPSASVSQLAQSWLKNPSQIIPLPHPSPRNNIWLKRNTWFEKEMVPMIQKQVKKLSKSD
ncbi:uracil-DNA glycosylase family protein [Paraglaciecola sp.]|uniref:uracil-DNA glycosylase family protein n=1 Tax=Paraglaciecola sp. TaxID=1920173 RepID=UPI00273F8EA7|nr:uracil-DNA glycosylase family protein [Paraglaciecola sp.]MDP5030858.1 uracil-DNA glycosylase family protein [Paraglaciecola sp.]MDP5040729.1 uracil-DNA glycosylase family protein [Paraglaciecola sp.]